MKVMMHSSSFLVERMDLTAIAGYIFGVDGWANSTCDCSGALILVVLTEDRHFIQIQPLSY